MKTIVPNQNFKHGRETYEKGKEYQVKDQDAHYFTMIGWVGKPGETGQEHNLEIQDSALGHTSEVK